MSNLPVVSICMIVYNQEQYIIQAIQGVLNQEVDFNIELIIANDCSTDNTDEKISEIIKQHPKSNLIKYFNHENNLGMMPNFAFALQQCKGKFIALCEGDDYWTDPLKLKKQVDFLNTNKEINICFHRANVLKRDAKYIHPIPEPYQEKKFQFIELLKHYNFITTASVVFRKPEKLEFPKWFYRVPFGDLSLYKLLSKEADIMCINQVMSVYRKHEKGAYSGIDKLKVKQNFLKFYTIIYPFLNKKEQEVVIAKKRSTQINISKLKFPNKPFLRKAYIMYLRYIQLD
ncbi:glycosyltransferase [Oceanihabitans sp. 2_MG-2023]|uniref:glycosyltransferase family 2 protein n=1 Tax=Oceanihabitans sp. 2_MG-2023 TaxID=3062661 RepID=UPI0026E14578|nr:glycosyltransferase [Oceanihabitans sp. 2_MG-2023]MDO6597682.1 glycosyltransferase [Oceanihabitans sp. 2_MG-2023]